MASETRQELVPNGASPGRSQLVPTTSNTCDQGSRDLSSLFRTMEIKADEGPVCACNENTVTASQNSNCTFAANIYQQHFHNGGSNPEQKTVVEPSKLQKIFPALVNDYQLLERLVRPISCETNLWFDLDRFYIEPTFEHLERNLRHEVIEHVFLASLFDSQERKSPIRYVLVRGNMGQGMSVLCQNVANNWSCGIETFKAFPWDSHLPVLFKLRYFDSTGNLKDQLVSFLKSKFCSEYATDDFEVTIKNLENRLLFMFDGYEELTVEGQRKVKEFLKLSSKENPLFYKASYLVTSCDYTDNEFLQIFNRHYSLKTMSENDLERLVEAVDKKYGDPERRKTLIDPNPSSNGDVDPKSGTRLVENFMLYKTVSLKEMPPFTVVLACWLVNQNDFTLGKNDFPYSYVALVVERCSEMEDLKEDEVKQILKKLGLLFLHMKQPVISEKKLIQFFNYDTQVINVIKKSTILREMQNVDREKHLWEATHKLLLDASATAILNKSEASIEKLRIREFPHTDFYDSRLGVDLMVSWNDTGGLNRQLVLFKEGRKYLHVNWDGETDEMLFSSPGEGHVPSGGIILDFRNCTWVIVRTLCRRIAKLNCINLYFEAWNVLEIMSKRNTWNMNITFTFPTFDESLMEEVIRPNNRSLLSDFGSSYTLSDLVISCDEKHNYEQVLQHVMDRLFEVSPEKVPQNNSASKYVQEVYNFFNKEGDSRYLPVVGYTNHNVHWSDREVFPEYDWNDIDFISIKFADYRF